MHVKMARVIAEWLQGLPSQTVYSNADNHEADSQPDTCNGYYWNNYTHICYELL